jgi:hypothetical protein
MAIKFLKDHSTASIPPEHFTAGQIVKDRSPESELHFVRRGLAGYYDEKSKSLFDHEGRALDEQPAATVVNVSDNRDGEVGRAGETSLQDGTPQRASSGPGEVVTSTSVTEGEAHKASKGGAKKG